MNTNLSISVEIIFINRDEHKLDTGIPVTILQVKY